MPSTTLRKAGVLVTAAFSLIAIQQAQASTVAMSCAQAIATFERNGRITVTTRTGSTLPIFNGVPVSQRSTLRCPTAGIVVQATDNPRCTIGFNCMPRGGR